MVLGTCGGVAAAEEVGAGAAFEPARGPGRVSGSHSATSGNAVTQSCNALAMPIVGTLPAEQPCILGRLDHPA